MKKVAMITGSSRGIGLDIAKALHEMGYFVIVSSSSYSKANEDSFRECFGDGFDYVYGDIKEMSTLDALVASAKKQGRLDLLVNNAGIAPPVRADILESTPESFDLVMATNLRSVYFLTQRCARLMIDQKASDGITPRIINIGSMSAYTSSTNRGEYCISKAGVSMITSLFADRLAEYSIPVFEIRPGIIETDMTSKVKDKYDTLIANGLIPMGRWGKVSDISKMVCALAGGAFDFGTGQVFNADGGFHLRRL